MADNSKLLFSSSFKIAIKKFKTTLKHVISHTKAINMLCKICSVNDFFPWENDLGLNWKFLKMF